MRRAGRMVGHAEAAERMLEGQTRRDRGRAAPRAAAERPLPRDATRGGRCGSCPSSSRASMRWPRSGPAVTVFGSARTAPDDPIYELARDDRPPARRGRLRGHHRRRARASWRRPTAAARRAAGSRSAATSSCRTSRALNAVRRPRRRVPLLLRAQDDVREVRRRRSSSCPAASARSTSCSSR